MTIQPGDEEKMRKALRVPDAMSRATGSDLDPAKAAELRRRADLEEQREKAEAEDWERIGTRPPSGS